MKQFSHFPVGTRFILGSEQRTDLAHRFFGDPSYGDYLSHVSTQELPGRGFSSGNESAVKNNEASVNWELIALDVPE
jgi:hypothetical protein